ncbi:SRPBCC domain-containing protein [Microbacterium sp. ASV81]|uniref:SRPBCC domain-containing protein n=1 Tax=Microbacterium capsulatum TaxID=3041921 RepID=A0ABU0XEP0_9MICO|nr:SRPBCC domain-containing protein [Microbacterium sp. ASV81]MDQ4212655.1 SRPBCC domain-containing protein [Microbacterium sp. ASV81]
MSMIATMRALDDTRGAVRIEDVYDTDIDDLWHACTDPDRLSRWIARVSGDLRVGGMIEAEFTSAWVGTLRIEICEAPRHLLLTQLPGTDEEGVIEVWLSEEGDRARLVVEDRGLPQPDVHYHAAGWQAHFEDLAHTLATGAGPHPDGWPAGEFAPSWEARWRELTEEYAAARLA